MKTIQTTVAGLAEEVSHELQIVVPVVIGDDYGHPELLSCLCLRGIFTAEPFQHLTLELVVAVNKRPVIEREEAGEVEAVNEFLHLPDDGHDTLFHEFAELWVVHTDVRCSLPLRSAPN
jgi:hypothetical protein